ncbi:putative inactive purple acid phosphatase 1, partial [Quercus suber]
PKLVAVSNMVAFVNPNAPVYPRLAQGKVGNEMTVTWTSGYGIDEAEPFVEWGPKGGAQVRSPTGAYTYKLGHSFFNGTFIWSQEYWFRASPYLGQNSLQHVIIFGDMGKGEADGSFEFEDFQPASLNTTKQLIEDLNDIDIVFHIGDIVYAMGYIAQWDQFIAQIEPIASTKPYMIGSGNHECDWPGTGSFYQNMDSGGECGVLAENKFYVPAENRANFWYSTDYVMFQFCLAHTELNWRGRSEQYKFIENCLASVDRQRQPWLIFLAQSTRLFFCGLLCGRRVI